MTSAQHSAESGSRPTSGPRQPPESSAQALHSLNAARVLLTTSTRLLREAGHGAAADQIIRLTRADRTAPVMAVLGESGHGKSSLVNALTGGPEASPGLPEGIYRLFHSPTAARPPDTPPVFVFADGSRSPDLRADLPVLGVELVASRPLPGGLAVLDAPAMDAPGARTELEPLILDSAALAVFVTDAAAPLSAPEAEHLRRCAARVDGVAVAITKVDLYPGSWEQALAEDRDILAAALGRDHDVPALPFSAVLAAAADSASDPERRGRLETASGRPALVAALARLARPAALAGVANALRLAWSELSSAARSLRLQAMATGSPPAADALDAERRRLSQLRSQQQRWTLDLERDLGDVRAQLLREAGADLEQWALRWRVRLQEAKRLHAAAERHALTASMLSELGEIRDAAAERLVSEVAEAARRLFRGVEPPTVLSGLLSARPVGSLDPPPDTAQSHFDPTLIMSAGFGSGVGASAGTFLTGALGLPAVGAAAFALPVAVALAAGGGWYAVNRFHRQGTQERGRLLAEVARMGQLERSALADQADELIRRIKPELVVSYREHLNSSLAAVQQLLKEAESSSHTRHREAEAASAALASRAEALEAQAQAVAEQLANLGSGTFGPAGRI